MSQEIGDISNSERLAVTQQLVNSDTDQKVGRISGSSDVNLRQSSTRVELTDLVDAIEEELRRLKQDEDSPSPSDLPFPSEIDGLPAETPIKREDVEETTVVLDELAIKAPLVRRGITDSELPPALSPVDLHSASSATRALGSAPRSSCSSLASSRPTNCGSS